MSPNQMDQVGSNYRAFDESIKATLEVSKVAATELEEFAKQDDNIDGQTLSNELSQNAMQKKIRSERLEPKRQSARVERAQNVQESLFLSKEEADTRAMRFAQRAGNREYRLDAGTLSALLTEVGVGIHEEADEEAITALIRSRMTVGEQRPDAAMLDKAFEFLLEESRRQLEGSTGVEKERLTRIIDRLEGAREEHRSQHAVEIRVAEKIIGAVDAVVETSNQNVHETLGRYRDMVHNPPELQVLRKTYEIRGFKYMTLEFKGLSAYLGANLKRNNLENPELFQLAQMARKMQALLQVYRQAKHCLPAMESYLQSQGVLSAAAA